jgi:hypothetical protein
MRTPYVLAFLVLVAASLLSATRAPVLAAQGPANSDKAVLAAPIDALFAAKFSPWRPKQLSDMDADDQQLWLKGPNGNEPPGIAIGHLESHDELSYAVLLVPKSDPSGGPKTIGVLQRANQRCLYMETARPCGWTDLLRAGHF